MIPVFFVFLKQLPLNANGKLDRSRLPVVESRPAIPENVSDPMADRICEFYAQVLGLKKDEIAPNSDFFKLGGHSLKANILKNKLSENLQVNVPLIELFQYTTPASLSIYLKSFKDNHPAELIPVSEAKPHYTLSHSQRRMYFLHLLSADQPVYNMPFSINREDHIDTGHFQTACLELLRVHEGLRASFHIKDGQVVQQINDIDHLDVATFQCSSTEARVLSSDFSKPFDLAVAPLFRVAVFHLDDINKTLILFDVHHILLDGVSADVIVNDLSSLLRGERIEVPALQNKDYAEWQQNSVQFRQLMNKQKDFWEKYLEQSIPDLILPTDFKRGEKSSFKGDHLRLSLDAEVTAGLREIADKANCSMFVVCLGLVNVFLFKITGQKEFLVGTTVDTRNSAQLSRTIGLFVNTVVIKAALADSLTFLESIRRQKEHVLNVLDNKDYPFDELVLLKKGTRRSNRNPLFDVNFAYFKQDDVDDHERIRGLFASRKITHLDLSLFVTETTSVLNLEIEYSSALFSRSNIERQLEILQVIALQVARNENILIDNIAFTEGENESTNFATGLNTSAAFNF
jgi:acyl carrier protein